MSQTYLPSSGGDPVLLIDATSGNETFRLPAGFASQRRFAIRRRDGSANTVTVTVVSGGSVDGATDASTLITPRGEVVFTALDVGAWVTNMPSVSGSAIVDGSVEYADLSTTAKTTLSATYVGISSAKASITYNGDGTVATVTEADTGAVTTYTYNADGTVATEVRVLSGVTTTRTFSYSGGNLTGVA